ncbi:HAD family hydrolase [Amycolatopsis sp. cmx-11-51]|uniref:HAD family hydrolase n=1 Tax=unclassified Amycolatopsis TaxID=2618356 RepID=UPI0039E67FE7
MTHTGLLLDFGGVVTTDFYGALRAFCLRERLPENAIETALATPAGHEALAAVESGVLPQRDYEQTLARMLGLDADGLLARALADLRPRTEVYTLVDRARAAGITVGVLSNSWGTGAFDPYAGYGLEERFDAVVISDQVGMRKPDPAIYRLAADQIGVQTGDCVFVDDTPRNLPPASELGMVTVLFPDTRSGVDEIERLLGLHDQ